MAYNDYGIGQWDPNQEQWVDYLIRLQQARTAAGDAPTGVYTPPPAPVASPAPVAPVAAPRTPTPAAAPAVAGPASVGGLTSDQLNTQSIIVATLRQYGLDSPDLIAWAKQSIINGSTADQLNLELYDPNSTPGKVVDRLYPGLQQRIKNGYTAMSIGEAASYKTTAEQYARANGLPPDLLDPDKLIANNVSLNEVSSRLDGFYRSFQQSAPDVVQQLHDYYGYSPAQVAALAVNPDVTEAHLLRQFTAGQIGAEATRTGFGPVGAATAEQLAAQGVSDQQALQGFGNLAGEKELFAGLPGSGEDTIDQATQVAAQFSNSQAAQLRIERRRQQRQAAFAGGGGFGAAGRGVGGLGSAEGA